MECSVALTEARETNHDRHVCSILTTRTDFLPDGGWDYHAMTVTATAINEGEHRGESEWGLNGHT